MTYDELKAEATRQGYRLTKSSAGYCTCHVPRAERADVDNPRRKCIRYEYVGTTKQGITKCRRVIDR